MCNLHDLAIAYGLRHVHKIWAIFLVRQNIFKN